MAVLVDTPPTKICNPFRWGIAVFFCLLTTTAAASSYTPTAVEENTFKVCKAHQNFKESFDYLKSRKDLPLNDTKILKAALSISKGCDGSATRFKKIFELLEKSGVDLKKSYELAMQFSSLSDAQTDNFVTLFKGLFLENRFDLDFNTSFKASLDLSAHMEKDWDKVRKDFNSFLKFCEESKKSELSIRTCAQWTLGLLKESNKFPDGVFASFEPLNSFLVNRKGLQLPIAERLQLTEEILKLGPSAPDSFKDSLLWLQSKDAPSLPPHQIWKLAFEISKNSSLSNSSLSKNTMEKATSGSQE